MQERFFAALTEGMDVYDVEGDKVGTVGEIFRPARVASTAASAGEPAGESYLQVDTGLLGLGKDLFIPASAVGAVSGDRVTLNVDKDALDELGWDRRPDWIKDD